MKESKLYQKFKDKIKEVDPDCFFYKIPDTSYLGGKKPFDGFLVMKGYPFAIEFKVDGKEATDYQAYQLEKFKMAGGRSIVCHETDFDQVICHIINIVNRKEVE